MVSQAKSSASKLCFLSRDFNGVALFEFVFSSSSGMSSNSPLVSDGSVKERPILVFKLLGSWVHYPKEIKNLIRVNVSIHHYLELE